MSPEHGDANTIFTFDATGCSDQEDSAADLLVRWDWQNDGEWDTVFFSNKKTTHQFSSNGAKIIKLEVRDSGGLVSTIVQQLTLIEVYAISHKN